MKIGIVAPLFESIPPRVNAMVERVVSYLTEELVVRGHDLTLFASGDSHTRGTLLPQTQVALNEGWESERHAHLRMLEEVRYYARDLDIVHLHIDYLAQAFLLESVVPTLTTLHRRADLGELAAATRLIPRPAFAAVWESQRRSLPFLPWEAVVPHGVPPELCETHVAPGDYLLLPEPPAGSWPPDGALAVARRTGLPLQTVSGDCPERERIDLIGGARALLVPSERPGGLAIAMIEAAGCGTPVVARRSDPASEIVAEGITGFLYDTVGEAVDAVGRCADLDRDACRLDFELFFTVQRMADEYERLYRRLARGARLRPDTARELLLA